LIARKVRTKRRYQVDTIVEECSYSLFWGGIYLTSCSAYGITALTTNIDCSTIIDDAFSMLLLESPGVWSPFKLALYDRISDAEAVSSPDLGKNDGLFLGSSSACNLVACISWCGKWAGMKGQTILPS